MKKLMLVAAMVLGTAAMSFAQSSVNGAVTVTANVIQALSISPTSSTLALGDVAIGTTPYVDPQGKTTTGTSATPILFTVTGQAGHAVTVSYPTSVSMNQPTGSATLTFTPAVSGTNASGSQGSSNVFSGGSSTGQTLSSGGNYYVYVGGGTSTLAPGTTLGSYSGTFDVTVTY